MLKLNLRKAYLLLLVICLACHLALILYIHAQSRIKAKVEVSARCLEKLERMHAAYSFTNLFDERIKGFFTQVRGKELVEARVIEESWKKSAKLADDACEFVYFNNSSPLNVLPEHKADWQFLLTRFDCGQIRKFRTPEDIRNRIIKFLGGGVGFSRLEAKPGKIQVIGIGDRRSYGVWFSEPAENSRGVNGLIVFFHKNKISEQVLASALLEKFSITSRYFGCINIFKPQESVAPAGFDPSHISSQVSSFDVKSGVEILYMQGARLLVNFKPSGTIMCALLPEENAVLPVWSWALLFFWLPLWLRGFITLRANSGMSLRMLIFIVFALSIALPLLATTAYWNRFIVSRTEAGKIAAAHSLEQHLVQLDAGYPQIFRTSRKAFADMIAIANGRPENLQEMIDQSIRLELDGMYDTCLLIDPQGEFIRPYSGAGFPVRRLALYARAYREKVFQQYFYHGWVPFDLEAEYALYAPEKNIDLREFITLMPAQGKSAYSSLTSFLGKDLIALYNRSLDGSGIAAKEEVSSMIMSTFVENEDENPVAKIRQSLGDYVEFGFNSNQSVNFVDLIRDKNGRALFCAILFSGQYNFSYRFLDALFKKQSSWPPGIKYMAVSDRLFNLSFPYLNVTQKMKWLMEMMKPPRNLHVEERSINGKPHLLCAYVGKNCPGYVFVATVPIEQIEAEQLPLQRKLRVAALLVSLTLLVVWAGLYSIAIRPAGQIMAGVRALAMRQHSYRIALESGDEWQKLGETFNVALEGLKELEVAHFVQTCILPAGNIISGNAVFAGRTVPADDVGGDYYDAFALPDNEMMFLMGDVSGHSISAALVVSMARAAFAAIVDSGEKLPHLIFAQVNRVMLEHLRRAKMMTCFAGLISADGILTCSNAGQTFPILVTADGSVEIIKQIGYPLGVARKKAFACSEIKLPDCCRLVMFSDGVVEAMNDHGEPFGYERLEKLVKKLGCKISREDFFTGLYAEVKEFSGDVPWGDDVTVALLDYNTNVSASLPRA